MSTGSAKNELRVSTAERILGAHYVLLSRNASPGLAMARGVELQSNAFIVCVFIRLRAGCKRQVASAR